MSSLHVHHSTQRSALLALTAGLLLVVSFPSFSWGALAWIAIIPLLAILHQAKTFLAALKRGGLTALVFFGFSLHWLVQVSGLGWIFITLLEMSFFVIFIWTVYEARKIKKVLPRVLWIALGWTVMEVVRAEIPIFGLGWNLLAYSQSEVPWVRQSANAVGAYGLGFGMVLVNALIFEAGKTFYEMKSAISYWHVEQASRLKAIQLQRLLMKKFVYILCAAALVVGMILAHGIYWTRRPIPDLVSKSLRITVVQGNIPQSVKWEAMARDKILDIYKKMTELAFFHQTDFVIWPEAAFPGYFNRDLESKPVLDLARKFEIPILVGAPHLESEGTAFNSAYLIESSGEIKARYDKQYLVPFGEYVPLKLVFGFLAPLAYTLGVSDFTEGREATVFHLEDEGIAFSTLICFEDVFPNLARAFADRGAEFLAVITNDAWFGKTAAPYQHLQASVFRAIETGIPVVRAANTGVSAFISSRGEVLDRVRDSRGKDIFSSGYETYSLPLNGQKTLYRNFGWIFPYVALGLWILMFAVRVFRRSKTERNPEK